jgi:hypothetical protein
VPTQKEQELQRETSLTKKKLELRQTADQQRTNKQQDEDHASAASAEEVKIESGGRGRRAGGGVQEVVC